ncbi:MAG TPA: hypothetical protein ENI68_06195, partial [Gammaproteobacteria bacterium]|nr:hypothetical protein [Gammaproteobacteria bacterium]
AYTVSAIDNAVPANESAQSTPPANVTTPAPSALEIRVNAGGSQYTDGVGKVWAADTGFNTGKKSKAGVGVDIIGTTDDPLYQLQRYDAPAVPELSYSFTVPNGDYTVNLHFAENYSGAFGAGARVFSVAMEGVTAIGSLDIFGTVGANTSLVRSVPVTVSDGQLNIQFIHEVENPIVAAVEIVSTGGTPDTSPPTVPQNVGATAIGGTQVDVSWTASTDVGGGVVAGYKVYRADVGLLTTVTGTGYSDTSVLANTPYAYTVSAIDNATPANESAQSTPPANVTTPVPDTSPPAVPQNVSATAISATQVGVSWDASTDVGGGVVAGYKIYRADVALLATVTGTGYSDTSVVANTPYAYTVSALDNAVPANESALSSPAANVTTPAPDTSPPTVPQNVGATAISDTQVDVSWTVSTDVGGGAVAGYKVYRADVGLLTTVTGTGYSDTSVVANTPYNYTVSAIDNATPANESAQSTPAANVTTPVATGCSSISTLACSAVRVIGGYTVSFTGADGGMVDTNGLGIGFTMVDPPTLPGNPVLEPDAPGYWADKLVVDTSSGKLRISTTAGIQYKTDNSLDNALGVGLNLPGAAVTIKTTLSELPSAPGGWAQAGLWFGAADNFGRGTSEDNYIKLIVGSPSSGRYVLQTLIEQASTPASKKQVNLPVGVTSLTLKLVINPGDRTVQARYDVGNDEKTLQTFNNVPNGWFSFDPAGIDPTVATRSYGGIFASHRGAPAPQIFSFDDFSVTEGVVSGGGGSFAFSQWAFPIPSPTSMVTGPDNRLYVTEISGLVHAITLDHNSRTVIDDQVINTIQSTHTGVRLALGITVDPASTPDNIVLWVSHTGGAVGSGVESSGIVSRLSGPGFLTNEDRITGLPRGVGDHALNSIHFGPDGKLYLAAAGNTGAGAPNLANNEFGNRPEQPLSAAILVADVNDPGFQGNCATPAGQFGIPTTCDVAVYASGLRNAYDFVWHSNGELYAPDNGLGVTGTYPPFPTPPCTGLADTSTNNPGTQDDLLYRILPGKYYGHPNPYRNECVFKDGSIQGVAPLPNFEPPLFNLGRNPSADGTIDYQGDAFYSKLMGQLLIANYSKGDDITRIKLSADGTSVLSSGSLIGGFQEPLPLAQDDAGNIYVGELTSQQITVLVPLPLIPAPTGSWTARQPVPEAILDAGGTAVGDKLYMVGGKTSAAHVSSLYIYDPVNDSWLAGPDLPGAAVEDSAVTGLAGKLYVFGGGTGPFSGAVNNAAVFDPSTSTWTSLAPMITARAGATAMAANGKIYVAGGMAADGASLDSVEIYDPVADSWTPGTAMQTRRDNPGSAVFNDKLYVFGGRTRNADGSTVNGTLATIEIFDPATNAWTFGSPMPTGRRRMVVGTISGRAQVMGGENPVFSQNEEYDPATDSWRTLIAMSVPSHGAVGATIRGVVYAAGGGPVAGSSFTNANAAFTY